MQLQCCKYFLGKIHQYNTACRMMVSRSKALVAKLFTKRMDLLQYSDSESL